MKKVLTFALMILAFSLALSGCQTKNPSEKTDLTQDLNANTQNNETTPNQETTPNEETIPADDTPVQEQHNWWDDMEQKHIVPLSDDIAPEDAPYEYYPDGMYFYLIDNSYKNSEKLASWYPIERRTEDTAPVEITDTLLERIKDTINRVEERCPALIDEVGHGEPNLGQYALVFDSGAATMVAVVGDYDTLEKVCDAMKDLCSPVAAQKRMNEHYVHSLNGRIYYHAAGGMPTHAPIESISREDVTEVVGNVVKLDLKRKFYFDDCDEYTVYSYTVLVGEDETVYLDDYDIVCVVEASDAESYIYDYDTVPKAVDIPW